MTDYRTEAEKFVTSFLDYIKNYDILDQLNRKKQIMERSPGVQSLINQAESVFPKRLEGADIQRANEAAVTQEEFNSAIEDSDNIIDLREVFARKVRDNGGVRAMLRAIVEGQPGAQERAADFIAAIDGEKEFALPPKV